MRKTLTQLTEDIIKKHKKPTKNCLGNQIIDSTRKIFGERKKTPLEEKIASLHEQSNTTTGQDIYPKRNSNYQVSFQALSKRFPNLAVDAGGIDVCKAIYVNDATKEVTVQFPNLYVELLQFSDLITIV